MERTRHSGLTGKRVLVSVAPPWHTKLLIQLTSFIDARPRPAAESSNKVMINFILELPNTYGIRLRSRTQGLAESRSCRGRSSLNGMYTKHTCSPFGRETCDASQVTLSMWTISILNGDKYTPTCHLQVHWGRPVPQLASDTAATCLFAGVSIWPSASPMSKGNVNRPLSSNASHR